MKGNTASNLIGNQRDTNISPSNPESVYIRPA